MGLICSDSKIPCPNPHFKPSMVPSNYPTYSSSCIYHKISDGIFEGTTLFPEINPKQTDIQTLAEAGLEGRFVGGRMTFCEVGHCSLFVAI